VVLTGLVFVALSLNVNVVTQDATYRYRHADGHDRHLRHLRLRAYGRPRPPRCGHRMARGRSHLDRRIPTRDVQAARRGGSSAWLRRRRVIVAAVLYLTQLVSAALLVADQIAGLYVAAVAMVAAMTLMISGAWLLLVGVTMREPKPFDRSP
jgi:hypothetical protein